MQERRLNSCRCSRGGGASEVKRWRSGSGKVRKTDSLGGHTLLLTETRARDVGWGRFDLSRVGEEARRLTLDVRASQSQVPSSVSSASGEPFDLRKDAAIFRGLLVNRCDQAHPAARHLSVRSCTAIRRAWHFARMSRVCRGQRAMTPCSLTASVLEECRRMQAWRPLASEPRLNR